MFNFIKKFFKKEEQKNENDTNVEEISFDNNINALIKEFAIDEIKGNVRVINKIIIHCSSSKPNDILTKDEINLFFKSKGYENSAISRTACPYHFLILSDGAIVNCRKLSEHSANSIGNNSDSISICYVGGLDEFGNPSDTRTNEQKTSISWLLSALCNSLSIKKIYGHNLIRKYGEDLCIPECPCFDAYNEYKDYF
jgi:N-acetylmuramoyl-L-alanine amidase